MTDDQVATIRRAAAALNADVYYVSGTLSRTTDACLRDVSERSRRHDRCVLVLTTGGGDADAAYLMARFLRGTYQRVTACVFGYCKSAGTLLALGCHEIAMGLRGELGPLDVQVSEKDEPARFGSGLETVTSLNLLTKTAFASFERYLVDTIQRSGGQISTKTAAELATNLTVGLVAPISAQINPIRLGREQRAMEIASAYAARLSIPLQAIARLTAGLPRSRDRPDRGPRVLESRQGPEAIRTGPRSRGGHRYSGGLSSECRSGHRDLSDRPRRRHDSA